MQAWFCIIAHPWYFMSTFSGSDYILPCIIALCTNDCFPLRISDPWGQRLYLIHHPHHRANSRAGHQCSSLWPGQIWSLLWNLTYSSVRKLEEMISREHVILRLLVHRAHWMTRRLWRGLPPSSPATEEGELWRLVYRGLKFPGLPRSWKFKLVSRLYQISLFLWMGMTLSDSERSQHKDEISVLWSWCWGLSCSSYSFLQEAKGIKSPWYSPCGGWRCCAHGNPASPMVTTRLYMWCQGPFSKDLPATALETLNQHLFLAIIIQPFVTAWVHEQIF